MLIIAIVIVGLLGFGVYQQLSVIPDYKLSPDWAEPIESPACNMVYESSSCDRDLSTRMLWERQTYSESCTPKVRWVFNAVQDDIYGIELNIMNKVSRAYLEKVELTDDDVNYVEVWSGHQSLAGVVYNIDFETQSVKSAKLTFWMEGGSCPGITEIFFLQEVEPEPEPEPPQDSDEDGIPDTEDNCPNTYNPDQLDDDNDGVGDVCDTGLDTDGDGVPDEEDNCPTTSNSDQKDSDGDGIGDVCDPEEPSAGIPGFELFTLITTIGIAFCILRRRLKI